MPFKRAEVAVSVQQLMPADNASGGQHNIDGPANGHSKTSELPVVFRRLDDYVFTIQRDKLKPSEQSTDLVELLVDLATLQYLREVQVPYREFLCTATLGTHRATVSVRQP